MINKLENLFVEGQTRPFLMDIYWKSVNPNAPLVLFAHGFKGFKDWGHWTHIAECFAQAGFVFAKFNFSHNGTTPEAPTDFVDLQAFGQNTFSKELQDLDTAITHLCTWHNTQFQTPTPPIALIGHSRGGPIVLLQAARDTRVQSVSTWAAVSNLAYAWPNASFVDTWRTNGQYTVKNGRTGQEMPLFFSLYEDYVANQSAFSIPAALQKLRNTQTPLLIMHGTKDPAVSLQHAKDIHQHYPEAQLHLINGANHVFGGKHPFDAVDLPKHSQELVAKNLAFLETKKQG